MERFSVEQQHGLPAGLQRALNLFPGERTISKDALMKASEKGLLGREKILRAEKLKERIVMRSALIRKMLEVIDTENPSTKSAKREEDAPVQVIGSSAVLPDRLHQRVLRHD